MQRELGYEDCRHEKPLLDIGLLFRRKERTIQLENEIRVARVTLKDDEPSDWITTSDFTYQNDVSRLASNSTRPCVKSA